MDNKHVNGAHIIVISEKQIKTKMRYYYLTTKIAKMKNISSITAKISCSISDRWNT